MDTGKKISLRDAREQKGLSAAEAAEAAGVSTAMIYEYERRQATPRPGTKKKLADLYGFQIAELDFKPRTYRKRTGVMDE